MFKFVSPRSVLLLLAAYLSIVQALLMVYHRAECIDNESFKKFGKVDRCEIKLGKRSTSVLNLKVYFSQAVSPDLVGLQSCI